MSEAGIELGAAGTPRRFPRPPPVTDVARIDVRKSGMAAFLVSEVAFFSTLIVAYIAFLGRDIVGPTPREALSLGLAILGTVFLLSSSATIHLAEKHLARGARRMFAEWWLATIALGAIFLACTAYEWRELIEVHHLTISRNLFGTTYYTLVGFHALHVTVGLVILSIILWMTMTRRVDQTHPVPIELASWYWHFVDCVWVVVFTVVYLVGR